MTKAERKKRIRQLKEQVVEGCPCLECVAFRSEIEKLEYAKD